MVSLKNKKGFTIVELLIVIVVIGILATLVIVTFTGIQQKARNTQRKTDINAINSHVEAFYAETGSYPTLAQLQDSTFRDTNMKGLKVDALTDPKGGDTTIAATSSSSQYGYASTAEDDSACAVVDTASGATDPTTNCAKFTLTATMEDSKSPHETYTKSSE